MGMSHYPTMHQICIHTRNTWIDRKLNPTAITQPLIQLAKNFEGVENLPLYTHTVLKHEGIHAPLSDTNKSLRIIGHYLEGYLFPETSANILKFEQF